MLRAALLCCLAAVARACSRSRFAILDLVTLDAAYLARPSTLLNLEHGIAGHGAYARRHGYDHSLAFHPPAGLHINWNRPNVTLELCACHRFVVWMEADQYITNSSVRLDDLEEELPPGDVVITRDAIGCVNSGVAFVRCGRGASALMRAMHDVRRSHAEDKRVVDFDHQGALMVMEEAQGRGAPLSAGRISLAPARRINAFPVNDRSGRARACAGAECDRGWWSPGEWLVHFAGDWGGGGKPMIEPFLKAFPPASWV